MSGEGRRNAKGEISGAFLLGLEQSFLSLRVLPRDGLASRTQAIDPEGWYPYDQLVDTLDDIAERVPAAGAILFRAGIHFIRLWYEHGAGKTMIHSGRDWLYANLKSGGYNTVVRGGPREEIGWCDIQRIDEDAGVVVYENVNPLAPDFVRGIFYGGCLLFDDMDYADASVTCEDYPPNPDFIRTMVTVRYRYRPGGAAGLEHRVARAAAGEHVPFSPEDVQRLVWRYQSMKVRHEVDTQYFDDLGSVLVATNERSLGLAGELREKVDALQAALTRVQNLEGILPICAWCKRLRENDQSWVPVERYLASRTSASFTHTICPACEAKMQMIGTTPDGRS